jgi:hypothetical protein
MYNSPTIYIYSTMRWIISKWLENMKAIDQLGDPLVEGRIMLGSVLHE